MIRAEKVKFPSELRFDPVSKDWILIATGRAKRPETFAKETRTGQGFGRPKSTCPFCQIEKEKPLLEYKDKKGIWFVKVVKNKYPPFLPGDGLNNREEGPYHVMDGV